ncbi:MAG: HAD family hydrolase [Verrucomicrobia bacterium]|nr:HAD family hydrolase [Verrucomicrobiota bacterium]
MKQALSGYAVFDLDGTLADSLGDIARALGRVFLRHGKEPIPKETVGNLVGRGPRSLVERGWFMVGGTVDQDQIQVLTAEYLDEYKKNPKGGTRAFPGVDAGLRRLVQVGWRLGICTNKDGSSARALVQELGWGGWIRVVISGQEGLRKPDPHPLRLAFRRLQAPIGRHLFIGDSEVDLQTARNAGVTGVFLGHGYGKWGKTSSDGMRYFDDPVSMFSWMARASRAPEISRTRFS